MFFELMGIIFAAASLINDDKDKKEEYRKQRYKEENLYELMMDLDEDELEEYKDNDDYDEDDY